MMALAQALSAALLHFVWQGLLVAFLLWTALFLLRKRSAEARYRASCAALAILAVLPVITAVAVYTPPAQAVAAAAAAVGVPPPGAVWTRSGSAPTPWLRTLEPWALPVWSLGVLLFSLRLVWGCRQVAVLRRQGRPADAPLLAALSALAARMGVARPVRILITSLAEGPSVVGWLRPVILLPSATLLGLTPDQLEAVLAHEFAHIRRYDYLVNLLQILAETLLFYHPAVWWTSARIRHERELCCDDLAVRCCGDALCYARALTRLERLRVTTPALALGSTGGSLLYRIQRLAGGAAGESGPSKLPAVLALSLGLVCFGLNLHWAHGQEPQAKTSQRENFLLKFGRVLDAAGVTVDLGGAAVLHRTGVEYPWSALENSIQGTVAVEATLDAAGNVLDALVTSGPAELRKAALQSVLQWHFAPDQTGSRRQVALSFRTPPPEARREERGVAVESGSWAVTTARTEPAREEVEKLERQIGELQEAIVAREQAVVRTNEAVAAADAQTREMAEKIAELENRLQAARESRSEERPLAGRTLKRIDVIGLSDQLRTTLVARLPVHIGDAVTHQAMEAITAALRQFDEHLEHTLVPLEDGQIELRIMAPGFGVFELRRK